MAVVRGDRIAESKKLNLCSFSAHVAYGTFVGCVPDDFGRFRATPTAIAERMFPRREADRRKIEAAIRSWLAEWSDDRGEGALVKLWTVDGVQWGEMTGWRQTGNLNHRTPEPPWSTHVHDGRCVTTALARAREWGDAAEVERLSLLLKKIREQRSSRTRTVGGAAPEHPSGGAEHPSSPSSSSSPSSPSSSSSRENASRRESLELAEAMLPSTAGEIEERAGRLAEKTGVPQTEWIGRASRIESSGRAFTDPRRRGISDAWGTATIRRLREFEAEMNRPVPF